ncbi:MAG: hypothetical protein K2P78_08200 [Gemmataceae bacterium]|nr:hypothetical protein [Gemmataceae bacterium]
MRTALACAALAVLLAAAPARAADGPSVAALIEKLGADDYATREQAGKDLLGMGDKVLPDLRKALAGTDNPEVSRRLAVLVRKLDLDRLVAPRRVTLSVQNKPVKDVVEAIAKQTGYKLTYNGSSDAGLTVDWKDVPFWEAVDRVALSAGLMVQAGYDDDTVQLFPSRSLNPFVAYTGPFRVVAQQLSLSRSVQLSGLDPNGAAARNRGPESLNLSFQVFSEPKNPILGTTQAELVGGADDLGGSIIPPKDPNNPNQYRQAGYYNQGYRGHQAYGNLNLVRSNPAAAVVRTLKGRIGIVMLAGVVPEVVVPDPLKVKNKKYTGRTIVVEVESVTETGANSYAVTITVSRIGGNNQYDYSWSNNLWQKLELVDEQGGKYRSFGYNSINHNPGSLHATMTFGPDHRTPNPAKLGPPVKLTFNEWQTLTHDVAFEFKDVPLP